MSEEIKIVSIIGVGYLGKQIAERAALKGYIVRLYDTNVKDLEEFSKKLKKIKETAEDITLHETIEDSVKDADLVIEAVPELL